MTEDQLDEARAKEAWRLARAEGPGRILHGCDAVVILAARLAREGWTPTDPDLIEARRACAGLVPSTTGWGARVLSGDEDADFSVRCALAAIKQAKAKLERGQ